MSLNEQQIYVCVVIPKGRVTQNPKENFCNELQNLLTAFARQICQLRFQYVIFQLIYYYKQ